MNVENIRLLVLGSILTANEFGGVDLHVVFMSGIHEDWFDDDSQKSIFKVMMLGHTAGKPFDDNIILSFMKKEGIVNPENLLLEIMAQKSVPQNILMEHIAFLKEQHSKKMLLALGEDMLKMLHTENINSDLVRQMVQNALDQQVKLNNVSSTKKLSEVRKIRKSKPPVERRKTNIPFIDTVLTDKHGRRGFRNEGLVFISGLKESGKTFVATKIIENVSKDDPVMFGSMEFGEELYDENIEEQQENGYFEGNIDNIYTFDAIYEVHAIAAEIRLFYILYGIKLVVLDSMLRMRNNDPAHKTDEKRISDTMSILGKLSKELKIPIVVIVQSSKEDLKSSMISVKGSMDADHEAYVWFHLLKTKLKDTEDEMRTVIWNKNKDTHKHPKQHLMFVPQTSDFYRVEIDEYGNAGKALDKFRRPPLKVVETVYENIPAVQRDEEPSFSMPAFMQ